MFSRPPVFEFDSKVQGPSLLIFGAVHGNEVCGPRALFRLIEQFKAGTRNLKRGRCTLVPVCNQLAYDKNVRSIDENLNRVFTAHHSPVTNEQKIAASLAPLMAQHNYFLDLHSMQSRGDPFVFLNQSTPQSEAFCLALGTKWVMVGWPELYAKWPDKASMDTQTFADSRGVPNALIECGTHGDTAADEVAYQAVLRAMAHLKMIDGVDASPAPDCQRITLTEMYFREHVGDSFAKVWQTFEPIRKDELIGTRADGREVRAPRDGLIVFPSPVSDVGTEWFYVAI